MVQKVILLADAVDRRELDMVLSEGAVVGQVVRLMPRDMDRQDSGYWSRILMVQWVQMFGEESIQMTQLKVQVVVMELCPCQM